MKPLKRFERYASAIFTLGRIKTMAKDARRAVDAALPRVDRLEQGNDQQDRRMDQIGNDLAGLQTGLNAQNKDLRTDLDDRTRDLNARIDEVHGRIGDAHGRMALLSDWNKRHETLAEDLIADYRREAEAVEQTGKLHAALLSEMFSAISRQLDGRKASPPAAVSAAPTFELPASDGFEMFKDNFYHRLENKYRGAPEEIARRLKVYLPDVEAAWLRTDKKPAMDIGCGRGEWLGLLKDHGIDGFGVDTNEVQIEEARAAGLDVRLGDALAALAEQPDNSLSLVTAHHLIEHLPFDAVAWITRETMRVLAPGGLLLFETPNTRNVLVGATTFHTDPTHIKPMPEQVMEILLETAGFDPIDMRGLNPHARFGEFLSHPDFNDELAFLMFGPQDLAILGTKPEASL